MCDGCVAAHIVWLGLRRRGLPGIEWPLDLKSQRFRNSSEVLVTIVCTKQNACVPLVAGALVSSGRLIAGLGGSLLFSFATGS